MTIEPTVHIVDDDPSCLLGLSRWLRASNQQAREERIQRLTLRRLFDTVSPREREVLGHVLGGRLNKQIASDLGIGERTVKVHRQSLIIKLKVRSVAALARLSQEAGVCTPGATFNKRDPQRTVAPRPKATST